MAGPPSIISSRMTDIASDDGADSEGQQPQSTAAAGRRSQLASDVVSRPGTARTGLSSSRTQSQPLRRALSGKRASVAASTISGSTSGRPGSVSRSHVPSLTSHAFFRPMSSQKLQAQRSVGRPSTVSRRYSATDGGTLELGSRRDAPANAGASSQGVALPDASPQLLSRLAQQTSDDGEVQPPPSRGTEVTEHETVDRITANTSPTYGHYPTGSLSESVRPLQSKPATTAGRSNGLSIRTDSKSYRAAGKSTGGGTGGVPTPMKSPRSFRSSFLLPAKGGDSALGNTNRNMQGGEKLDSVASSPQLSPSAPAAPTKPLGAGGALDEVLSSVGRNFEHFEGNTVFCMGGRLQNTRSQPVNIATGACVVVPCVLFFAFSAQWIWHNIHPAIPVTFGYLFYVCLSSFLHASSSDPGILPRSLHRFPPPDENEDPLRLGPATTDWTLIRSAEASTAAMEVPTKYCKTCNIWRPPRAHHCRLCDNCIETADHHCVWLNNCIGRRNYRYFFTFVSSATLLSCYLIGASLAQILVYMNREDVSFGEAVSRFRVPFAMVIYGFLAFLYPAALMVYHIFLMARGETTREFLNSHKFLKKDRYRAFTQGSWLRNWVVVLCRPRPPTYYRFKSKLAAGDQRLASQKRKGESREGMEMQDVGLPRAGFQEPSFRNPGSAS